MKIYLLERKDSGPDWDDYYGFVVLAESAGSARALAHDKAFGPCKEEAKIWLSASATTCKQIGIPAGKEKWARTGRVILDSFRAG